MENTIQTANRFSEEAAQHIEEIEALRLEHETAVHNDAQSRTILEQARGQVAAILNDRNTEVNDCAERWIAAEARLKIIEHRFTVSTSGAQEKLFELAERVDAAEGFLLAAPNYLAREIRAEKARDLALEFGMRVDNIDRDILPIKKDSRAMLVESFAVPSRLSHANNIQAISASQIYAHADTVLQKLRGLAEFEFQSETDEVAVES